LVLGQEIYTPLTTRWKPESGDRAYAGWLGASIVTRVHTARIERVLTLTLGVTGPLSLAGPSQRSFHRLIGESAPSGWTAQLGAEPTLDITYAGSVDLIRTDAKALLGARITPVWNASLGTVHRAAEIGVEGAVELGASGVSQWRQSSAVESAPGFYLVGAIRGRVVAGNLFLDGGFFRTGPSVGHLPYVRTMELGVGARADGLGVEWRVVTSSREYATQGRSHTYTTLAVTI
jgi:lipid A 3-O-deacylase